jgi:Na+-transporting NADH:ubiquinone oxidoreductase subunit D
MKCWAIGRTLAESTGLYHYGYENNGFMLLAPMALITVGIIIWVQRSRNTKLIED